jgi:hypothetical protein
LRIHSFYKLYFLSVKNVAEAKKSEKMAENFSLPRFLREMVREVISYCAYCIFVYDLPDFKQTNRAQDIQWASLDICQ